MISQLRSAIESILLVADEPVQEDVLARVTQASEDEVRAICREFQQDLVYLPPFFLRQLAV